MKNCEFSGRICTSREGCKIVLKIRSKSCIKVQKSPKHFCRECSEILNVVLSKKADKRIEVVTRALKKIRGKYLRIKFNKTEY